MLLNHLVTEVKNHCKKIAPNVKLVDDKLVYIDDAKIKA